MLRRKFTKNENGRDFVCGDLHGAYDRLLDGLNFIKFDLEKDRMFSVGDLVDRGPDNEKCLELLDEPWFFPVTGNHEQLMNDFYTGGPYSPFWLQNGGSWGEMYLGGDERSIEIQEFALRASNLPLMNTVEMTNGKSFHVIHAELGGVKPLSDAMLDNEEEFKQAAFQQTRDGDFIVWGRYIFRPLYNKHLDEHTLDKFRTRAALEKIGSHFGPELSHIYSGHTIMRAPVRFMGQTNIDTGAYMSTRNVGPYSNEAPSPPWSGLTITEPLTDRFWQARELGVVEIEPVVI